jgi:hypothetical protein
VKQRPGLSVFVTAILLRTLIGFGVGPTALAAATNCGAADGHLYSALNGSTNTSAALADVDVRASALCDNTSHYTASAAWSMVESTDGDGWVQIGYVVQSDCGGCRNWFWQAWQGNGHTPNDDFFGSPGTGITKRFKVTWQNGAGENDHFNLYICDNGGGNCIQYRETTWNPTTASWPGNFGLWAGETKDNQDDMPGTSSSKANFDNIQVRIGTGTWASPNTLTKCLEDIGTSGCNDTVNAYSFAWVNDPSDDHFRIWTDPINR